MEDRSSKCRQLKMAKTFAIGRAAQTRRDYRMPPGCLSGSDITYAELAIPHWFFYWIKKKKNAQG